jgi:hypothetical protein
MKKLLLAFIIIAALAGIYFTRTSDAQERSYATIPTYEYGIIRYDTPDKIQFVLPTGVQSVRAFTSGLNASDYNQEASMVWALNHVSKDGWQPVTLETTRVLIRRSVK